MKKVNTSDRVLETIQSNVADALDKLAPALFLDMKVTLAPTVDIIIKHGLGKPVSTFFIVDSNADLRIWRSATVNNSPKTQLILNANAAGTATIRLS